MSNIKICGMEAEDICKNIESFVEKYKDEKNLYQSPKGLEAIADLFSTFGAELSCALTPNKEKE